ncbi:glycosyltransferase family 2 protein [Mesorhizobium ventifaucium]|uniref:Glyco_trans_2-like domain-containing protein n=1 Tax=Mesorhizobium ventifaucium TaxID=666020 RepID=A0ABM9DDN3_9HYPH|nr:glycosyltransferase family 2 protein [Mesorhizobium ventifaucium]CAH2394649.1 Glyco_trans_2-like domain-containing protein [Mesorhizobium ventifaucium]
MQHSKSPQVSLGMPVYNGENFVSEAIRSILEQDFGDFELIIADNASTDRTAEICLDFAADDQRIRYVRNERNLGASGNYNLTFQLARGEFFKWCAHDDFISPNFVRLGVKALVADPEAVVAYGKLEYVDANSNVIPKPASGEPNVSVYATTFPDMTRITPGRRFRMLVAAGGSDNAMFGIMRRAALAKTSLHRKYYMSDRALLVDLAVLGTFVDVPGMTLYNRDHAGRSTKLADKMTRSKWTNPGVKNHRCFEHLSLLSHQLEIAWKGRSVAPLHTTLPYLTVWALHPFRVGCYVLELIGAVSPNLRQSIGTSIRRLGGLFGKSPSVRLQKSDN